MLAHLVDDEQLAERLQRATNRLKINWNTVSFGLGDDDSEPAFCAARRSSSSKGEMVREVQLPNSCGLFRGIFRPEVLTLEPFVHSSKRFRLYFDETGNGDLHAAKKDQNQRYLSLTGLAIRQDQHDADITKQLDALKTNVFGRTDIILHRREIIDAKGPFGTLHDAQIRDKFDAGFLALVNRLPPPAFTVSIDKEEHLRKYQSGNSIPTTMP